MRTAPKFCQAICLHARSWSGVATLSQKNGVRRRLIGGMVL
jgi:hypothetical protein